MSVFVHLPQRLSPGLYRTCHRRRAATAHREQLTHPQRVSYRGKPKRGTPPQKKHTPWAHQCGFWFKAIQDARLPKGSTPAGTKNTSKQLNSKPCWIVSPCRWAPRLISARLCRGAERAQVAVRELPGFRGDANNVRRAKRGKTSLVKKLLVSSFTRNLAKFPSGPDFFKKP